MKNLNNYIHEAWSGIKKQASIDVEAIEKWCDEIGIKNYTINSKGEIDVDGGVNLRSKNFKVLPYKFGEVSGYFDIGNNPNLMSLKNCPYYAKGFNCSLCPKLNHLKDCPKEVSGNFWCKDCKRKFTTQEVNSLCKVKGDVMV